MNKRGGALLDEMVGQKTTFSFAGLRPSSNGARSRRDQPDLDIYATRFMAAGAMRAGFELYRAFDRNGDDNRAALKRDDKLTLPVLAIGKASFFASIARDMLDEVAADVRVASVPRCGHWIAEEQPGVLVDAILGFAPPARP